MTDARVSPKRILAWLVAALIVAAFAVANDPNEAERVDLIPPMVCERGHVPECWVVGE